MPEARWMHRKAEEEADTAVVSATTTTQRGAAWTRQTPCELAGGTTSGAEPFSARPSAERPPAEDDDVVAVPDQRPGDGPADTGPTAARLSPPRRGSAHRGAAQPTAARLSPPRRGSAHRNALRRERVQGGRRPGADVPLQPVGGGEPAAAQRGRRDLAAVRGHRGPL